MTMPDLWTLFDAPAISVWGWTLLHFVWQGALLAAVVAGALRLLHDHRPEVRYAVSCAALGGLLLLPVGTALVLSDGALSSFTGPVVVDASQGGAEGALVLARSPDGATPAAPSWRAWMSEGLQPLLPWVVAGWGVGVLLFSVRLAGGAWRVRRLRRSGTPAPARWQERMDALANRLGLRADVRLRRSDRVDSPLVAGWWRPVVLVPAGLLSGLPPEQVEALLLHELAHIQRHDVLVGRLQAVVETLLFFHPATWWISNQVRHTRETCCDDQAVAAGTERTVYARALTSLAERVHRGRQPVGALAAADGSLLERIQRVVRPSTPSPFRTQRLSMAIAVLLLVGLPALLAACASQQSAAPAEEKAPAAEAEPAPTASPAADRHVEEEHTVTIVRDDSTEGDGAARVDSTRIQVRSRDGVAVVRFNNGSPDTLKIDDGSFDPEQLREQMEGLVDEKRLEKALRLHLNPDSLERSLRARFQLDSLERHLRREFDGEDVERMARRIELRADSISQLVIRRVNPDSLSRALTQRFEEEWDVEAFVREHQAQADSLRHEMERHEMRWQHEVPEHLREQARRLREQAERLEERARKMESPDSSEAPPSEQKDNN